MQRADHRCLREALAAADATGRKLVGSSSEIAFADLTHRSILPAGSLDALRGRNVLLATDDQVYTALALIELDGLARRIVLCPPDLQDEHLPPIFARAEGDAVVTDRPRRFPDDLSAKLIECGWPPRARETWSFAGRTEWVLLTSGTTGVPKMVSHSFRSLTAPITPKLLSVGPIVWATFYDIRRYGGLQMYLRGVLGTGSLILSGKDEPVSDFLDRLAQHGVTHLAGTPTHWRRALMSPALGRLAPSYLRLSGEIADQGILDRLRAAFPKSAIGHAYASTEAGVAFEVDG